MTREKYYRFRLRFFGLENVPIDIMPMVIASNHDFKNLRYYENKYQSNKRRDSMYRAYMVKNILYNADRIRLKLL